LRDLRHRGAIVKWNDEYKLSLRGTVNLADYYDLSQSGQYEVFYAETDLNLAITNADSHEYFAENTPSLP
jgi:hypothetical protein